MWAVYLPLYSLCFSVHCPLVHPALGTDRASNKYFDFRSRWGRLYNAYKPGKMYWELVITARKFGIAVVALAFRATPSYQLAMALLGECRERPSANWGSPSPFSARPPPAVLFAAYVLHMRNLPYLTHADKSK